MLQLLEQFTNRVANGLMERGFKRGDFIALDMPMTVESVAIYLGIIKVTFSFSSSSLSLSLSLPQTF
jgi:acetyl-CoA synthetase